MRVVLAARAHRDFDALVGWLRLHSPEAGRKAALRIVETIDLLSDFPELGQAVTGQLRDKQIQFGRDGFVVRYRLEPGTVTVLRIFHGRQSRQAG